MNFIAPKNFKSGRLISNKYTWFDLVLLIVGIIGSVILEALFVILFLQENILVHQFCFITNGVISIVEY